MMLDTPTDDEMGYDSIDYSDRVVYSCPTTDRHPAVKYPRQRMVMSGSLKGVASSSAHEGRG